jgi:hypothetical protein
VIRAQALGNGAAGDVFRLIGLPLCFYPSPTLIRDATVLDLTPLPIQSDVDALMRAPSGNDLLLNWDVYFSVDPATAARLGAGISPADILYTSESTPGGFATYCTAAQLNLLPIDDIDALVILDPSPGTFEATSIIHASLTKTSPSAPAWGGGASMILLSPTTVAGIELGNAVFEVGFAEEVDALMAGDPGDKDGDGNRNDDDGGGVPAMPAWWYGILVISVLAAVGLLAQRRRTRAVST